MAHDDYPRGAGLKTADPDKLCRAVALIETANCRLVTLTQALDRVLGDEFDEWPGQVEMIASYAGVISAEVEQALGLLLTAQRAERQAGDAR